MIGTVFAARAEAAKAEHRRALALARDHAQLIAFAHHKPEKMPSLASLLGDKPRAQTTAEQMSVLKALTLELGGKVH
jgi:hypothetical protein